jgi:hypothetical protein
MVRVGQGKKSLSEQDKTRNDSQNRTGQEITVRAAKGEKSSSEQDKTRNHFQRRTSQGMTIRAGQGKKLSPNARRESKARSMVGLVLLLFEL